MCFVHEPVGVGILRAAFFLPERESECPCGLFPEKLLCLVAEREWTDSYPVVLIKL